MAYRLLLADDSITIQKVIELTFADEKIDVVAVSDGEQAITRLANDRFDIVLADIGMPIKDGFEVAAFVKGHPGLQHVPVILLIGAFDPVDDARVAAVGAAAVLAKPFEPQVLVARVRELLQAARPVPASSTAAASETDAPPHLIAPLPAAPQGAKSSVDEYFEHLDRAFATLNAPLEPRELTRYPRAVATSPPEDDETVVEPDLAPVPNEAASAAPVDHGFQPADDPVAEARGSEANTHAPAPHASALATTFATLLAVEQGELPPSALQPAPPSRDDDALVDRIVRRVVEQLSDRAVRDLASEIVSRTAERLVREEIDRIKAGGA